MDYNNKSYPACMNCQGVVDTSTTEIVGPYNDILKLNTLIRAKYFVHNKYRVSQVRLGCIFIIDDILQLSCTTVKKLPRVEFVINGESFWIHGYDYVEKVFVCYRYLFVL